MDSTSMEAAQRMETLAVEAGRLAQRLYALYETLPSFTSAYRGRHHPMNPADAHLDRVLTLHQRARDRQRRRDRRALHIKIAAGDQTAIMTGLVLADIHSQTWLGR